MVIAADHQKSREQLIKELNGIRKLVPRLERLTAEYRETERIQSALYKIAELTYTAENMDAFYSTLHGIVSELLYADNFYVALYETRTGMVSFPYFVDSVDTSTPEEFPFEKIKRGLTAWLMGRRTPVLLDGKDLARMREANEIEIVGKLPLMWMGCPLITEGLVTGAIVLQTYEEGRSYRTKDLELMKFVSRHITTGLERKLAREALERRVEERTAELVHVNSSLQREIKERRRGEELQAALFRIAELSNTTAEMSIFYEELHDIIGELIYAANFYIALWHPETEEISFPYRADQFDEGTVTRKGGRGLTEYVLRLKKPVLLDTHMLENLAAAGEVLPHGKTMIQWLGVPLLEGDETLGVLVVQSYNPSRTYENRDLDLMTFVSHHVAGALVRKRSADALLVAYDDLERRVKERTRDLESEIQQRRVVEQQLTHDALHDALTGLPNRTLFRERLDRAIKRKMRHKAFCYAVLFLDLDRFKVINDSLGHLVGDELLKGVSERIKDCLRDTDTVARLGGDEFVILLENISGPSDATAGAERILDRLAEPFDLAGQEVFTGTSIGLTLGLERYTNADDLLRDADAAMYRAKESGRGRVVIFDESMHKHAMRQLEMESFLHRCVAKKELDLYFQPILNLSNGRIEAIEALVRWNHPERGLMEPEEFLGLAKETGMIKEIDWWVLGAACRHLSGWLNQIDGLDHLSLHVNLSGTHFLHEGFADRLQGLLEGLDLDSSRLKLEVDEGALLEKISLTDVVLNRFKKMGIKVLLDDFGTRYSSLSYLHRFPMDTIKIDRSFITRMLDIQENMAITKTIHALGATLEMKTIAEGIETEEILEAVREVGCQMGQGYHLAEPMNGKETAALLAKGSIPLG